MTSARLTVAAVVLSRNRPVELRRLVGSLLSQDRIPDEIVIVDNYDDTDACAAALSGAPETPRIVVVRPAAPVGTATGRNIALARASADLCLLLDDDLVLHDPAAVDSLATMFDEPDADDLAAVTFRVRSFGPEPGRLAKLFQRTFDGAKLLFFLRARRPGDVSLAHFQSDMRTMRGSGRVSWIQGGATMVRRSEALSVGFDPRLELKPLAISEDVDFGYRLSRDHRVEYRADIESFNGHSRRGGTGGAWLTARQKAYITVRNYRYLALKNRPGPRTWAASWWALGGLGVYHVVAVVVRPEPRTRDALRGWAHGVRDAALLHESDRPSPDT